MYYNILESTVSFRPMVGDIMLYELRVQADKQAGIIFCAILS